MRDFPLVAGAALAVMVSLALAPAIARADECVCVNASMGLRDEPRVLQSVEVGPFFSSDGSTLSSDLPEVQRPSERMPSGDVHWCVSADDPRCSPRDSVPSDGFTAIEGAHVASSSPGKPRVGPPSPDGLGPFAPRGGPRPGVHDRIERPPRA